MTSPGSVYKYFDRFDILIYVGITSRGVARNIEHNKSKDWWQYVKRQEVEHFDSIESAHTREIELIEKHTPPFNKQHNRRFEEINAAYLSKVSNTADAIEGMLTLEKIGNGRVPLRLVDDLMVGNLRWLKLSTLMVSAPYAATLGYEDKTRMLNDTDSVGSVRSVHMAGPFAIIMATVRHNAHVDDPVGRLKIIPGKPPRPVFKSILLSERRCPRKSRDAVSA